MTLYMRNVIVCNSGRKNLPHPHYAAARRRRHGSRDSLMTTIDLDPEASRAEMVTAALIYLMTQYARTGCPRVAVCISRHMQCLALHPDAAPLLRDICASLHGRWTDASLVPETREPNVH